MFYLSKESKIIVKATTTESFDKVLNIKERFKSKDVSVSQLVEQLGIVIRNTGRNVDIFA